MRRELSHRVLGGELEAVQSRLGYRFRDLTLLRRALTHRSFGPDHNERLEFLGDGALNCIVAIELFERLGDSAEGELSRIRTHFVRREQLAVLARRLDLGSTLRLGEGERQSGGAMRESILADAMEAVIGALFIDAGFAGTRDCVADLLSDDLAKVHPRAVDKDPKTALQELLQARRLKLPRYHLIATHGAAHRQQFEVECTVVELELSARGVGASRRQAEQDAAGGLLKQMRT